MTVNEIFSAPIFLAPMAGVTDSAFRSIVRELIPAPYKPLMFAEMVSCNGIHYRNEKTLAMLQTLESERPIAIQLFGSDPAICAEGAKFVEELGTAAVIDFNLGCPAPKIVKNGEGSALMKNPKLVGEIFSAMRQATSLPLSAKIRLGFLLPMQRTRQFVPPHRVIKSKDAQAKVQSLSLRQFPRKSAVEKFQN